MSNCSKMNIGVWSSAKQLLVFVPVLMMLNSQQTSAVTELRNKTDRLALQSFKDHVTDDPFGVLNSWNDTLHHCKWAGVTCNARHQRVMALNLTGMNLLGSISPHIGNLSFLMSIQLGKNRLSGEIPQEITRLFRLTDLNLSSNALTGQLPANLSRCLELKAIILQRNSLIGEITNELTSLSKLVFLSLAFNNFTGKIPASLGNLSSLNVFYVPVNNFEGSVPDELGSLVRLSRLEIAINRLYGNLPSSIYNISTLTVISAAQNFFQGELPTGLDLKNLRAFGIGANQFSGNIPVSITNSTQLEVFDIGGNNFDGQVPRNLGNLLNLRWFTVGKNLLGQNTPEDLDFIASLVNCSNLQKLAFHANKFGGQLPNTISNLSFQLNQFAVSYNMFSGPIPKGLGRYINLFSLELNDNLFSGTIPNDFGKFLSLQGLDLGQNMLSGQIPSILCNLTSLFDLRIGGNAFEGILPPCLANCQNLKMLNVSRNKLTGIISPDLFARSFSPTLLDLSYNVFNGSLPLEVGKLISMNVLNISYNNLSGPIPETLGQLPNLEYLNMQGNAFNGAIPTQMASLKAIQHIDISKNNLTGEIPRQLVGLPFFKYLNLSFNGLEGEIPIDGVFENASLVFLAGNDKLCGGILELHLPLCKSPQKQNVKHLFVIVIVPVVSMMIFISVAAFYYFRRTIGKKLSFTEPFSPDNMLRISYQELHHATVGFSEENLIGSGNFGFVYRGTLEQDGRKLVAVKVLDVSKNGASKSFKAECQALRNIRHRNLVAILTYCSSIDFKLHEFKALVYELMENGSLDMWLHPQEHGTLSSKNLSFFQRLEIAVDVASALDYLHNYCEVVIVHCDLKPSNILLDKDLTAHVGDFGLARLLSETTTSFSEQETSSTIGIKGTLGYAAPEYGMGGKASTEGDCYSFGILLLEIFTGKRPTDDTFRDGVDLHNYVKMNLAQDLLNITDSSLLWGEGEECLPTGINGNVDQCLISIFEVGLKCSATYPNDRMPMNEVLRKLQHIKDAFVGTGMKKK